MFLKGLYIGSNVKEGPYGTITNNGRKSQSSGGKQDLYYISLWQDHFEDNEHQI